MPSDGHIFIVVLLCVITLRTNSSLSYQGFTSLVYQNGNSCINNLTVTYNATTNLFDFTQTAIPAGCPLKDLYLPLFFSETTTLSSPLTFFTQNKSTISLTNTYLHSLDGESCVQLNVYDSLYICGFGMDSVKFYIQLLNSGYTSTTTIPLVPGFNGNTTLGNYLCGNLSFIDTAYPVSDSCSGTSTLTSLSNPIIIDYDKASLIKQFTSLAFSYMLIKQSNSVYTGFTIDPASGDLLFYPNGSCLNLGQYYNQYLDFQTSLCTGGCTISYILSIDNPEYYVLRTNEFYFTPTSAASSSSSSGQSSSDSGSSVPPVVIAMIVVLPTVFLCICFIGIYCSCCRNQPAQAPPPVFGFGGKGGKGIGMPANQTITAVPLNVPNPFEYAARHMVPQSTAEVILTVPEHEAHIMNYAPPLEQSDSLTIVLNKSNSCLICKKQLANLLFTPCGHRVCCNNCDQGMKFCPYCSQNIQEKLPLHFPKFDDYKNNLADEKYQQVKDKVMKDQHLVCFICLRSDINSACLPCGHLFACEQCLHTQEKCLMCSTNITSRRKVV